MSSLSAALARHRARQQAAQGVETESPRVVECTHAVEMPYRGKLTEWRGMHEITTWLACPCGQSRSAAVSLFADRGEAEQAYDEALQHVRG